MSEIQSINPFVLRQSRLSHVLLSQNLSALALNPGPSLTYLTGLHFHLMERPVVAIFNPNAAATLILPELELAKTEGLPYELAIYPYGEDPSTWSGIFKNAILAAEVDNQNIGIEPGRLRVLELRYLEQAAPGATIIPAQECLDTLRIHKDSIEVEAMQKAVHIAQVALQAALPTIRVGVTEQAIAAELILQLLRAGSEPQLPFFPIVSGGPNSANPHASPTERPLQPGDLLVIDWGATYQGYVSDLTRTFGIGPLDEEFVLIAQTVHEANRAGRLAARPGVSAETIDNAARQVIERAGFGQFFIHRTGHGLGMEGHEAPYIRSGNDQTLDPGMTFTVEPGIYLPNRGGVRIEDDVVITAEGSLSLSNLPRELQIIPS